jgi:hypothetical protein
MRLGWLPLDSAPSVKTDDSAQALDLHSNRYGHASPAISAENCLRPLLPDARKRFGTAHPATYGFRTSTKKERV